MAAILQVRTYYYLLQNALIVKKRATFTVIREIKLTLFKVKPFHKRNKLSNGVSLYSGYDKQFGYD